MEFRPFGRTGVALPVVGQGTWAIETEDRARAVRALRRGIDLGMTHIDTAEMYGSGRVEEIVGEAIRGRRDDVFLASKVLPSNASYEGTLRACERSLARLGTDRLDLYLLHWLEGGPLEETLRAFRDLRSAGKIRLFGVSNFDVPDLERAEAIAGAGQITCNQVLYHIGERAIEHALVPWCDSHGVAVVAYSPFGSGRFPEPGSPGGRLLAEIGRLRGATARQVAIAFLLRHSSVFAIPKATTLDHGTDNAGADRVRLTNEDLARLDGIFPRGEPRGLPML